MKQISGFTLLELAIVVLILGVLAAIAIPGFLTYPSRARESEAISMLRAGIKAQGAHYLEFRNFAISWKQLDLGAARTNNYSYSVVPLEAPLFNEATAIIANPLRHEDKAFLGAIETVVSKRAIRFSSAICESTQPIKKIQKLLDIRARKLRCKE